MSLGRRCLWAFARVLAVVTFLSPQVAADKEPTLRKWRDFVYGQVRPDGLEYFDFDVTEDVFRVYFTFDRGTMVDAPGPSMLLKYGGMPSSSDYDQMVLLNATEDFYNVKVENLRVGKYFFVILGGNLFQSMTSFVGSRRNLFYFVNIWYYGCSDTSRIGVKCNIPVLPAEPIETPTSTVMSTFYPDTRINSGCVDNSRSTIYYTFDVKDSEWDITLTLTTSSSSALKIVAGANILEPTDLKAGEFASSADIASGIGTRSVNLRFTAPKIGHWMVAVIGSTPKASSCAASTGIKFDLTAKHERDCSQISGGLIPTGTAGPTIDLCSVTFTPLNEIRYNPSKTLTILDATFDADTPSIGDMSAVATMTRPVAGYVADFPKHYAGANFQLSALVTANIPSFHIYARVDGYPTPTVYDYQFNSSTVVKATRNDNVSSDWSRDVLAYSWPSMVFPLVGRWHLLFVADGTLTPPAPGTVNGSYWAVDVSLKTYGCASDGCSSHGDCEIAETYRGYNYGSCSCHYGYGGDQCQDLTLDASFRNHQIFLLIFSNLAILPVSVLTFRRKLYLESALFFSTGLVSAVYHACDTELVCIFPYKFLQQMDFALSFNMIMLLSVHFSGARKQAKAGVEIVLFLLTIVMATNHATSMANWVLIGAFCVLQFSITLVYYFVLGSQRMGLGKLTAFKAFALRSQNFDIRYGILGLVLWIVALSCWFTSTTSNYWLIHSIWHIGAMLSAFCFIGLRKNDRYKMIAPNTGIDVLGPNFSANQASKQFAISNSLTIAVDKEMSMASGAVIETEDENV